MARQEEGTVQSRAAVSAGEREGASATPPGASAPAQTVSRNDPREAAVPDGIHERSERVREDAKLLLQHTSEAIELVAALARARLERHRYTTILTAAGIGYVLGGGLPKRLVSLAIGIGLRQVAGEALGRLLTNDRGVSAPAPR